MAVRRSPLSPDKPLDEKYRAMIRSNMQKIIKDLEPSLLLHYMTDVLRDRDIGKIRSKKTRKEQARTLLEILPRRGSKAFFNFIETLQKEQPHLVNFLIEETEKEQSDLNNGCRNGLPIEKERSDLNNGRRNALTKENGIKYRISLAPDPKESLEMELTKRGSSSLEVTRSATQCHCSLETEHDELRIVDSCNRNTGNQTMIWSLELRLKHKKETQTLEKEKKDMQLKNELEQQIESLRKEKTKSSFNSVTRRQKWRKN